MDNTAKVEEVFESIEMCMEEVGVDSEVILPKDELKEDMSLESMREAIKSEIEARLEKLETIMNDDLTEEEAKIIELVKETLRKHHLKFTYDPDRPKMIELAFGTKNKTFRMQIILQNKKVIFKAPLPIRVQCNSLAIISMFIADFNKDKAFSHLNLDPEDGELTMEYTYLLHKADDYSEKEFWIYMMSIVKSLQDIYTTLCHLALGKISDEKKSYYKTLLEKSLAVINGEEEDEENIIFGTEGMDERELDRDLFNLIKKRKKTESPKEKEEENPFDFLEVDGETRRISPLEEFMRRKKMLESLDDTDETEHNEDDNNSKLPFDLLEFPDSKLKGIVEEVDTNE